MILALMSHEREGLRKLTVWGQATHFVHGRRAEAWEASREVDKRVPFVQAAVSSFLKIKGLL